MAVALGVLLLSSAQQQATAPRLRYTINDGWTYHDDRTRPTRINLPHTWNAEDAFTKALDYRRGIGWYERQLSIDAQLAGKRLFLHFEGANQVADVFVNGDSLGRHIGGYTAFAFEITEHVKPGQANVVRVRVDNRHDEDIPPLNADFTFYGGIYRDVWLIATEPVHVTLLDHASPGVFIDTPTATAERAIIRIRGTLVNQTTARRHVEVVNRILDGQNRAVAEVRSRVAIAAGGSARFEQRSAPLHNPQLWSPDHPYLYRVVTDVYEGGSLVDRVENPLGIRWFNVDAQRGFSLNGRPLRLLGTNRHQDRAGYANALPDWAHRADVATVKSTGFNFLRLAHYPQDPAVLDAMDRAGLVGWEEIPVVNLISVSPSFAENAERMLVEMIRQHYNHPSILFWGYMNEVLLRKPDPIPEGYYARVLQLAKKLDARAHAEDSSRATVMAISIEEIDDGTGMQDVSDIIGFNLYFGWYYRTLEGLGAYLDSLHTRHPHRPLMVSEYGADSDERIHTLQPTAFDFSTEHQQRFHETQLPQLKARDYLIATAVWNQFDFGSKGRHDSKANLNQKGLLYFDRTPKDVWHYYRALLRSEPVLHIAARDWLHRAGSRAADAIQPITVYSNADRVELLLNGNSQGSRPVDNGVVRWMVTLNNGRNRIEARAANMIDALDVYYDDRASLFSQAGTAAQIVAVNAGAHYQYVDAGGTVWEADRAYERGGWGHVGGEPRLRHHRIYGTDDDALFQFERIGVREYRFDVPDGNYEVELRFVETEYSGAGRRVFGVQVNGQLLFARLDLAETYGRWHGVSRRMLIEVSGGAGIVVSLAAEVGQPTISGLLIRRW